MQIQALNIYSNLLPWEITSRLSSLLNEKNLTPFSFFNRYT
jgi:hypothetical protein